VRTFVVELLADTVQLVDEDDRRKRLRQPIGRASRPLPFRRLCIIGMMPLWSLLSGMMPLWSLLSGMMPLRNVTVGAILLTIRCVAPSRVPGR
jgi:hypothetical protein